jgi:phage terminase large subunit
VGSVLPWPEMPVRLAYVPRSQFIRFHRRKQRHAVLVTHRRCGKTVASICDLILKAIKHAAPVLDGEEGGRYAYIATTYSAGKDIAWEMLKSYARPFLKETPNESELRVDFWNGSRIKIYGADNPDALRGRGFNLVVLDEYADMPPSLFPSVIRPSLAEKRGRLIFIGTVKGRENHLWQTYTAAINDPDWYADLAASQRNRPHSRS